MRVCLLILVIASLFGSSVVGGRRHGNLKRGINGGMECAACTVLVSMFDQLAEVNNQTIIQAVGSLCEKLPDQFTKSCQILSEALGPFLVEIIAESANPDDICRASGACFTQKGEQSCALYPKTVKLNEERYEYHRKNVLKLLKKKFGSEFGGWDICTLPGIDLICKLFAEVFEQSKPAYDDDGDMFSTYEALRGTSWRGKDCDDTRSDIYPGRRPELLNDTVFDSNCNGIFGINEKTNVPYEVELCSDSPHRGVVVYGDSVGAHFHVPEEWFSPPLLTRESLSYLPFVISNEGDWPQLSLVTGYMDSIWNITRGKTYSIYQQLKERNRCIHRDYQNLAVNGHDSNDVIATVKRLSRNQKTDNPLLIVLELVGNDVCNNKPNTLKHMTTAKQMHDNLQSFFQLLNETAPYDSKVLIVGMADGGFLYKFLHNRTHPFGRWRNDLTYSQMYDWWNCMQVGPCNGWLNNNETVRNLTTQRSVELSKVMKDYAVNNKQKYTNLEINYIDCPIVPVLTDWMFKHGPNTGYQLIEPVDGFHPNQLGEALSAKYVWNYLELHLPHYLGKSPNPHNDKIKELFGDQGGY